ncbi:hypothetical protein [Legionella impletisoli]|uniref:Coiled-coil protein n=1 Tax=Legionella impletisoli TaxID=343510 RepID=A0A917NDE4_9GAMM|nr:hypothetical protein [Legionella impletisoli]GGI86969.1 hypothetical protein GCM10007966_14580 [Legionella impletisoli]
MPESQGLTYREDKQSFFKTIATPTTTPTIHLIREEAKKKDYAFAATYLSDIEQDFNDLFNALQQNGENRDKFWYYCYYCALILQFYYKAYGKKELTEKYKQLAEEISTRYEDQKFAKPTLASESYLNTLGKQLASDLSALAKTPLHSSKIKDMAALANITRMQIVFSRIFLQQTLIVLKESELIGKLIGRRGAIDGMLNMLDKPTGVFNVLSVGLFAIRFTMNVGTLLKHTFFPNTEEAKLPMAERFRKEFNKRHCEMLNDLVWGTVNGLTNYAHYFKISASAAGWTMAAFLVFDVALLMYRRRLAEEDYFNRRAQYIQELENYKDDPDHQAVIFEQMDLLDIRWQATNATFWFNITAAILLMGGFSAALMLASPVAVPVSFFVCCFAIAMYVSGDMYGKYKEKALVYEYKEEKALATKDDIAAVKNAWSDFIIHMAKSAIVPMVIMGVFAVSWPAALALAVLYIGYEFGKGYLNLKKAPEEPKLPSPESMSLDHDLDKEEDAISDQEETALLLINSSSS